jgi:subtilisin-like proprotein convertase family protein
MFVKALKHYEGDGTIDASRNDDVLISQYDVGDLAAPFGPGAFSFADPAPLLPSANALAPIDLRAVATSSGSGIVSKAGSGSAGYTASSNVQWNLKATFGADPSAVLAQFHGQGVKIADYDDGIDLSNLALKSSYDASSQLVINGVLSDPTKGTGVHGTATAGIIVADASTNGGKVTGMAYGAKLTAVDIFSGAASGNGMLAAIKMMANFDVTNNSWGWTNAWADQAGTNGSFGQIFLTNLKYAADTGRAGLGTIIVHAAGNDWQASHRSANAEEFSADRHVITVGAIGQDGSVATYSNRGSSLLVSAASWGGATGAAITTTDRVSSAGYSADDYTTTFGGTSAATPEVTAVVADMLSANKKLGWRDVQSILALTAVDTETSAFTTSATGNMAFGWQINKAAFWNGGGMHYSNDVGFGAVDGHAAIREAEVWSYFTPAVQNSADEVQGTASITSLNKAIKSTAPATFSFNIAGQSVVEHADLTLKLTHNNIDHLKMELISPDGTDSILLSPMSGTQSANGLVWTFGSEAFRGEHAAGTWQVKVSDTTAADSGTVVSATLNVYGAQSTSGNHVFHYTDEVLKMETFDPTRATIHDKGAAGDWIDTAPMTGKLVLDLHSGATSTVNGQKFLIIGTDTIVNKATLGDGVSTVICNDNGDFVVGGHGAATFIGGLGNDTFISGYANDTMTGGLGFDTFVFNHTGFGRDTINDFTWGQDKISLAGVVTSFSALGITDTGSQITIAADALGDVIVLANTHGSHLSASDFLFA